MATKEEEQPDAKEEEIEETTDEQVLSTLKRIEQNTKPAGINVWVAALTAISVAIGLLIAAALNSAITTTVDLAAGSDIKSHLGGLWGYAIAVLIIGVLLIIGLAFASKKASQDTTFDKLLEKA